MANSENVKPQEGTLASVARTVGAAAGKVARALGASAPEETKPAPPEDLYRSDYIGSGTFIIKKPKRSSNKMHQSRAKSPQRGARK